MSTSSPARQQLRRTLSRHVWKIQIFNVIGFAAVVEAGRWLPRWGAIVAWAAYVVFVLVPMTIGIGPLGRRFGRRLNEDAVALARHNRAALGAGSPAIAPRAEVPSGPGGED